MICSLHTCRLIAVFTPLVFLLMDSMTPTWSTGTRAGCKLTCQLCNLLQLSIINIINYSNKPP